MALLGCRRISQHPQLLTVLTVLTSGVETKKATEPFDPKATESTKSNS